jgi:hypothetical protein
VCRLLPLFDAAGKRHRLYLGARIFDSRLDPVKQVYFRWRGRSPRHPVQFPYPQVIPTPFPVNSQKPFRAPGTSSPATYRFHAASRRVPKVLTTNTLGHLGHLARKSSRTGIGGRTGSVLLYLLLGFEARLLPRLGAAGGDVAAFLTSSTTSCHQCSTGPLSNPSSCRRVSPNRGSLCHPSQSARVRHVPTITRLLGLSLGRRSCPPTQPGCFFAAARRLRMRPL